MARPSAAGQALCEVGTGYFDAVSQAIQQGQPSTTAFQGSTKDGDKAA